MSGKLSSRETICIKCQNLFSGKNKKSSICQSLFPEETICIKNQSLFSGKNKKHISTLLSAEFAQRAVKVKF